MTDLRDPSQFDKCYPEIGVYSKSFALLNNQGAAGTSAWADTCVLKDLTGHVFGTFTGSIQFYATNENSPPVDEDGHATGEIAIGNPLTAPGMVSLNGPYRYIRAAATALSSGAASANIHGAN